MMTMILMIVYVFHEDTTKKNPAVYILPERYRYVGSHFIDRSQSVHSLRSHYHLGCPYRRPWGFTGPQIAEIYGKSHAGCCQRFCRNSYLGLLRHGSNVAFHMTASITLINTRLIHQFGKKKTPYGLSCPKAPPPVWVPAFCPRFLYPHLAHLHTERLKCMLSGLIWRSNELYIGLCFSFAQVTWPTLAWHVCWSHTGTQCCSRSVTFSSWTARGLPHPGQVRTVNYGIRCHDHSMHNSFATGKSQYFAQSLSNSFLFRFPSRETTSVFVEYTLTQNNNPAAPSPFPGGRGWISLVCIPLLTLYTIETMYIATCTRVCANWKMDSLLIIDSFPNANWY